MTPSDALIGTTPSIQAIRDQVVKFADRQRGARRSPAVLIVGATGTGKGLLARIVHDSGPQAGGPFVSVNCAAIPTPLLEAELFGHERGAFTDARQARAGLFQAAQGGTLFLDEIGLLPLAVQAKLLTAIEDREVRRLGATRTEQVDCAIIAATNAELAADVRAGRFREDLYHRLGVIVFALPPLAGRGEDIMELARHFLARAAEDYGVPTPRIGDEAERALRAHAWPGNVRELAHAMERAVLVGERDELSAAALGLAAPAAAPAPAARATAPGAPRMLAREALVAALEAEGGNVARAAARLGIARSTLRYRLGVRPAPRGAAPAGPAAHRPAVARWEQRRLTWLLAALPVDMPGALERLTSAVETFGGRVEEAGTRQILVVFGLPPVEDAPERAALCAFTLGDARVVLHSARASIVRDDSTARIDLADKRAAEAALDALARAAGDTADVVADLATAHQLRLRFRLEPYGEDTGPAMFRVVGPDGGGRRPRGSPFVGRARERDLLLDRLRVARHGRGQIAAVAADAGMGKSRLVAEFVESIGDPDVLVLEGRCVAHAGAVPYTPVRDLVRQLARVNEGDPLDVIAAKLAALAESLDLDATAATSVLLSLLGAAVATTPLADLTPEAVRKRITETVLALVLGAASRRPVVVVIEDLHWADRSSEAWLGELVERVPGAAMLVVLTYRPGARPAWLERPDVTRMALAPLANDEAARIVSAARHAGALSDTAVETIVAHGDGNPFFLEELTRTVAESGPDAAVPDTVAGVLIARIDRLTEPSRQVLRAAAILGREFSPTLLAAISDGPIEDALADLVRRDFLHERGDAAERRYRFRHALTQEVAYETVADVDRRAGHLAAARALESLPGEQRELAWDQIARHYARTDDSAKAVTYHAGLAERAARRFAHQEAIAALQEGLRHAARLRDPARTTAELRLSLQLAFSYSMLGRIVEILPLLEPLAARLGAVDDRTLVSGYQFRVALTLTLLGRHAEGAAAAGAALAADPTEPTAAGRAHYVIALNHYTTSAFRDARAHAAHAMEHLRGTAERHWLGLSTWIFALSALALGDLPAAREAADRVAALGDVTEDRRLRSVGMSSRGLIQTSAGDYDDGRALCRQALAIAAADPPARMLARSYLGLGCLMSGDAAEAVRHLDEALVEARALRVRYVEVRGMAWLAEALVVSGELGRARPLVAETEARAAEMGSAYAIGLAARAAGILANAEGARERARAALTQAMDAFARAGTSLERERTRRLLATLAAD